MKTKYDDISNRRFGKLVAISYVGTKTVGIKVKQTQSTWLCKCDCGVEKVIAAHDLKRGSTVSCGCARDAYRHTIPRYRDIQGERFGRLIAVSYEGSHVGGTEKKKRAVWLCKCDCGGKKIVPHHSLKRHITRSCGCLAEQYMNQITQPIGHAPRAQLLRHYKARAKNRHQIWALKNEHAFWIFEQNCHYCGKAPELVLKGKREGNNFIYNTIDRVDSSKGYEPSNVVPCCLSCNSSKQSKSYTEFLYKKEEKNYGRT